MKLGIVPAKLRCRHSPRESAGENQTKAASVQTSETPSPQKICFFIASLGDGGAQRQCITLLNHLQELDDLELHLVLLRNGEHDDMLKKARIKVHRTNVKNFASPLGLFFTIRTIRRIRPNVLVSWLLPADIWSFLTTRVVRGIPWIMTERNSYYPNELDANIRRRAGRHATAIVANSKEGQRYWQNQGVEIPIHHIPNILTGPSDAQPAQVSRSRNASTNCLFVGRLEPQKNVLSMVSAFAHFATKVQASRLVVVGQGSLADEMLRLSTEAGIANNVQMLGFRRDVADLMEESRVLLSLSRHEGMPNVLMEAVAAGLPAIVSDIPEHRALLGEEYPFYVKLDAPPAAAAETIALAWNSHASGDIYACAREVLTTMAPEAVIPAYKRLFGQPTYASRSTGPIMHL